MTPSLQVLALSGHVSAGAGPIISWQLRTVGIVGSLGLLLFILELVRRRQLKEEYTVLWVITGVVLLLLAAWQGLLEDVRSAIGASSEASVLYFFGLIFVVFLLLHFSVRVSRLERRVVSLLQEIALLGAVSRDGAAGGTGSAGRGEEDDRGAGEGDGRAGEDRVGAAHEGAAAAGHAVERP